MTQLSNYIPPGINFGYDKEFNDIWGYASPDGKEYAFIGSRYGTHFIDVSNPNAPIEVDFDSGGGNSNWRDYKTYSHYLFGIADGGVKPLQIWDLQYLPDSAVRIYEDYAPGSSHNLFVNNDRLYLIGNGVNSLSVYCIQDPHNPKWIGALDDFVNIPISLTGHDAFIRGDTVYLSAGTKGLQVIDMSDPGNPNIINSLENYPGKGYNHASWMSDNGNVLIMADETHNSPIKLVDISDINLMNTISTFSPDSGTIAHNPMIKDCLAFISYYHMGVQVYDISNPATPLRVGFFNTDTATGIGDLSGYQSCWGVYPYLPSGNILASDRKYGLYVLSYDGAQPNCSGDFDRVVQMDSSVDCDTLFNSIQDQFTEMEVAIFPNPAKDQLNYNIVNSNKSKVRIKIFDIQGTNLIHSENLNSSGVIDLPDLKPGFYFIEINSGEKSLKTKVLIN